MPQFDDCARQMNGLSFRLSTSRFSRREIWALWSPVGWTWWIWPAKRQGTRAGTEGRRMRDNRQEELYQCRLYFRVAKIILCPALSGNRPSWRMYQSEGRLTVSAINFKIFASRKFERCGYWSAGLLRSWIGLSAFSGPLRHPVPQCRFYVRVAKINNPTNLNRRVSPAPHGECRRRRENGRHCLSVVHW